MPCYGVAVVFAGLRLGGVVYFGMYCGCLVCRMTRIVLLIVL